MRRRAVMTGLATALALAAHRPSRGAGMAGRLLPVRGTRLWVADSEARDRPAILYIHGGPGIGSLDFETHMAGAFDGRLRVVSVDQRGVLRSDPLPPGASVTIADLIADFEAVRTALGIDRWQILGHSFGGTVALRYALAHPARVSRLVLESPSLDLGSSFRWLCASAAQLLNGRDSAAALRAMRLADPATPFDAAFVAAMDTILGRLGDRRQDLYVADPAHRDIFSRLAATAGLPDARWAQGERPGRALLADPVTLRPMLDLIAQVRPPMLLIRGEGDHVTSPQEIEAVRRAGGAVANVPGAGHFVHVEQPDALARLVLFDSR